MGVRLNKVLSELNIGLQTAVDFLKKKSALSEIKDDATPNTKISDEQYEALVKNESVRKTIKDYAERGGRIIAECGGMMYLCDSIVTDDGEYPMCGVLPYKISARKEDRKLSLGYRSFVLDGKEYRGHEFHYTQFMGVTPESIVQVYNAKGEPVPTPVFRYKNVLASYTHLYEIV